MKQVYITNKIPQLAGDMLAKNGFKVQTNKASRNLTKQELKEIVSEYDALITLVSDKIDEEVLNHAAKKLRVIANYGVGFDNIDIIAAKHRGIIVCNTPGVAQEAVAEHTFMLILACAKKLVEADKYVRGGNYQRWDPLLFLSNQVWGKTIGIIGLGRIGTFVAQIAYNGFRMKILYFDIVQSQDLELLTEAKFASLDQILKEADFVTLHVPLMPKTRHLISKKEFKAMKNTAILINTARGPIVDEEALIWALKEGEISACGLDVYEHEPAISEELRTFDNVIFTPHTASATIECRELMAKIAAQNIIDVFRDKTPPGLLKIT